jgi:transcription initiation factor TFIIB
LESHRIFTLQVSDRCPECGKKALVEERSTGELSCSNCGFVVSERAVDSGPEWRATNEENGQSRSRTGLPTSITYRDMGLSTVVGRSNRDASGRVLSPSMRGAIERMRKWDNRAPAYGSAERNLGIALDELEKMGEKLGVSKSVKERAAYIYRKALDRGLLRGRSITGITAASLYAALRDTETPRTLKDVAAANNLNKRSVARDYRILLREMNLNMPVVDAAKSITRIASQVGLSEKAVRRAFEIVRLTKEKEISSGKAPMGLAASALYLAGVLEGEVATQRQMAEAAGVTEVTVRNRYKDLRRSLGRELGLIGTSQETDPSQTEMQAPQTTS